MKADILFVIPARYGSTRLPGKPLVKIAGVAMVERVYNNVSIAASKVHKSLGLTAKVIVATEHQEIVDFVNGFDGEAVITPESCKTGSDRSKATMDALGGKNEFRMVVNCQGDAPLTPPHVYASLVEDYFKKEGSVACVTPLVKLTYEELDKLRESKKTTPFTGTTCILGKDGNCIWFSKNIIPAIRGEDKLRKDSEMSPVLRHIGLYGYNSEVLDKYSSLPKSSYEESEGLEQLRLLESGYKISGVVVDYGKYPSNSGVDSPEDIARAEEFINQYGEFKEG